MVTALAPSARAFTTSVPRVMPPSRRYRTLPAHRRGDFRQRVDRAEAVVQLPPAVVRNVDHVDAMIDGDLGVFRRGDPFDDQRHAGDFFDFLGHLPGEHRLINAPGFPVLRLGGCQRLSSGRSRRL